MLNITLIQDSAQQKKYVGRQSGINAENTGCFKKIDRF